MVYFELFITDVGLGSDFSGMQTILYSANYEVVFAVHSKCHLSFSLIVNA